MQVFQFGCVTLLEPVFFSKDRQKCLVIVNAKGWFGRGRVGKKARQRGYGQEGKKACPIPL